MNVSGMQFEAREGLSKLPAYPPGWMTRLCIEAIRRKTNRRLDYLVGKTRNGPASSDIESPFLPSISPSFVRPPLPLVVTREAAA